MNGKYNGQTKSEYLKNYKRVNGYAADVVLCGRARTTKGFFVEKTGVIK